MKLNAGKLLNNSVAFWLATTIIGQWIFAFYVGAYHGSLLLQKGLQGMGETHMPNGYMEGDNLGNIILALHLISAVVIIAGGPLQLVPQIRLNFPRFHRYLGRLYLTFVLFGAIGGLYLVWSRPRPSFGSIYQELAISIEALLIVFFAVQAFRYAIALKIQRHQRWALRLFMVASGVWFLRIGYMAWLFIENVCGFSVAHFFDFWSFGSFLFPLFILELYFRTKSRNTALLKTSTALLLFVATTLMGLGIFLATKGMWLPRIMEVV